MTARGFGFSSVSDLSLSVMFTHLSFSHVGYTSYTSFSSPSSPLFLSLSSLSPNPNDVDVYVYDVLK